jgi:N-acetylmuramoyl-L-alanine amidase
MMTDDQPPQVDDSVVDPEEANTPAPRYRVWDALQTLIGIAILAATLFTLWTPENLFSGQVLDKMVAVLDTTPQPQEAYIPPTPGGRPRIGIVAGHRGNDSGAVCKDTGLTEAEINDKLATLVRQNLLKQGYDVDLLNEFDERLKGYEAIALVSIHNDSCDYINEDATGFKVAPASSSQYPEKATRLTGCLVSRYKEITGLGFHEGSITNDMTKYHAFSEINPNTTAAIIETGFMRLDQELLTHKTSLVADGVTAGILCFMRNEPLPTAPAPETGQ